jgi:parvulin-like peptidyl-prolyl isomerase
MQDLIAPAFRVDEAGFHGQLDSAVRAVAARPLREFLAQEGILQRMAREAALAAIASSVSFTPEETPAVIARLWEGVESDPPLDLQGDWITLVPPAQQPLVQHRWQELRLQKFMDFTYSSRIDAYFLERRADLERVVYGMIRVRNQGAAEELYLRLIDDEADFTKLASTYSLGDERYTHGLVGPMPISQPHPAIRQTLNPLAVGDIAPPLRIDDWVLILRMEHREPVRLNEAVRQQLTTELFEADLAAFLASQDLTTDPDPLPSLPTSRAVTVVAAADQTLDILPISGEDDTASTGSAPS